jgi:signal transduction histidine kinase
MLLNLLASRFRFKRSLRWNLLLLNLSSSILCLCVFFCSSYLYKHNSFQRRIDHAAKPDSVEGGSSGVHLTGDVIELFNIVNREGSFIALVLALGSISGTSLFFAASLNRSIKTIESAILRFNTGDYSTRVPLSQIPEINEICLAFNAAGAKLQDVDQRRKALVAELSHELRTPLTVVKGYAELLQLPNFEMSDVSKLQFYEQIERMERLLSDLQLLSQVEAGNVSLEIEKTALYPVLRDVANGFLVKCQQLGKTLVVNCPGGLPPVYCDELRVRQIISNLISNAIRYTPDGGVIIISSEADHKHLWVSVQDTGVGMTEEELSHVFDRFWRSAYAKTIANDGSGLGLAIAKRLVEMQSGQIHAHSEPNQGSTFCFSLPLV